MHDLREDPAKFAVWSIAETRMKRQLRAYVGCGSVPPTVPVDGHQVDDPPPCAPVVPSTEPAEPPRALAAPPTEPAQPPRALAAPPTEPAEPRGMSVAPSTASAEQRKARERFEAAVKEHETALRARARQLCRGHCDAQDVYQKAMLKALRAAGQIKDPTRTRAWLLQIVTNAFIDHVREQHRRPPHDEFVDDMSAPDLGEPSPWEGISAEDLRAAVALLPEDTRDTYRMFALEGRSYAEISKIQDIPSDTVGTRLHRARKRLRELLLCAVTGEGPGKGRR
jgi:RNA polymerase sigma-70 factor (ECF subfamily)